MADTQEKIILFEVDFNLNKSIEKTSQLKKELDELNKEFDGVKESAKLAGNELKETDPVYIRYKGDIKALNDQIRVYERTVSGLIGSERQQIETQKDEIKSISDLQKYTNSLIKVRKELDLTTAAGKKQYQEITEKINKNTQALKDYDKEIGYHQRNVGNYPFAFIRDNWLKITAAIGGAIAVIQGFGAIFTSTLKTIREFQSASNELSAITGKSGLGLKELEKAAIEMSTSIDESGNKISKSATEILVAFQKVASAKPELLENAEALKEVTKNAIILSQATGRELPLEGAVEALTQIMNQFNATAQESSRYINVLAAGAKFGAVEIPYLKDAIVKVGAVAKSANIDIESLTSVMELFGEKGISAETAGTGFKSVLVKLLADTNNYKDGVFNLSKAIENNSKMSTNAIYLQKRFGTEYFNLAQILFTNKERFFQLTEQVNNTSAAFEQSQTNTKGLEFNINRFKNSMESLIISIDNGEGILGRAVNSIVNLGSNIVEAISPTNSLTEALLDQQIKMNLLGTEILSLNENSAKRTKLVNELIEQYPEYLAYLKDDKLNNEQLETALSDVNKQYENKRDLIAKQDILKTEQKNLKEITDKIDLYKNQLRLLDEYKAASAAGDTKLADRVKKQFNEAASFFDAELNIISGQFDAIGDGIKSKIANLNKDRLEQESILTIEKNRLRKSELEYFYTTSLAALQNDIEKNEYRKAMMAQYIKAYEAGNLVLAGELKKYIDNYKEVSNKEKEINTNNLNNNNLTSKNKIDNSKKELETYLKNMEIEIEIWKIKNKTFISENDQLTQDLIFAENDRLQKIFDKEQAVREERKIKDASYAEQYKLDTLKAQDDLNNAKAENNRKYYEQELQTTKKISDMIRDIREGAISKGTYEEAQLRTAQNEQARADQLKWANDTIKDTTLLNETLLQINTKYNNLNREIDKETWTQRLNFAKSTTAMMSDIINETFGENTGIAKAAGLLQIGIDTAIAQMAAWRSGVSSGIPYPGNLIAGGAAASLALTQGLIATKKLMEINVPGGGGGSNVTTGSTSQGGTGTGVSSSISSTNQGIVNRDISNNIKNENNNVVPQQILVIDEVTAAQNKQNRAKEIATI